MTGLDLIGEELIMKNLIQVTLSVMASFMVSTQVVAGNLTIPNSFTSGTPAVAAEVNANFSAVESEVDDNDDRISTNISDITSNDSRITALESTVGNLGITRTISIPASAMSFDASDPITVVGRGLSWSFTFAGGTYQSVKAPADYAGGDVTFHIFFQTTSATTGVVNFFIRPTSFSTTEGEFDPGSISCTSVSVSGTIGFGTLYEQQCTIPASRLTGDWWNTTIQRQGSGATYPDNVIVWGAAFEYQAVQ